MIRPQKKLVLENGMEFYGELFGADCRRVSEVVFNTSVVGYQEIVSDPSYAGQIVIMTYPLAGNYGITDEDFESKTACIDGLIVRECCDTPSNFRSTKTLEETLEEHGVPCISGVDTRTLTKAVRDFGRPRGAIVEAEMPLEEALELIRTTPPGKRSVGEVSCRKRWLTRTPNHRFHVVAVDCGIKHSILRLLGEKGCNVTIVPFNTPVKDILAYNPDGVLLSNGPDNVPDVPEVRELFSMLKGRLPICGIGLGAEIIGLYYGAKPEWLGCGIHGDHPVRDLATGRIGIGVLNQSYCFRSLEGTGLTPTHVTVPEGYVTGFESLSDKVFGVQFQLEAAPGPRDFIGLIDKFIAMMEEQQDAKKD
ncbi:MAG: glutamine-hydrolyzing carbamoyl-phosphate synthase small subunit [Bacteroidales bacterium]|nr:glutamine-hydrolyzing carbamoyl-phosphate synthase small subunit [Bacteroidales bacterium]